MQSYKEISKGPRHKDKWIIRLVFSCYFAIIDDDGSYCRYYTPVEGKDDGIDNKMYVLYLHIVHYYNVDIDIRHLITVIILNTIHELLSEDD